MIGTAEAEVIGTAEAAERLGVTHQQLRRELLMRELAGLDSYKRVGRGRIIRPDQMEELRRWLRKRGLLAGGDGPKVA